MIGPRQACIKNDFVDSNCRDGVTSKQAHASNKAEYSAPDAPSRRRREGVTDLRTIGPTDGHTLI